MRYDNVPPHEDGSYHCHLDPISESQIFGDNEFQRLNQSLPDYLHYRELVLAHPRQQLFQRLLTAGGDLFARQSASSLTNTLVYEVQTGATMLVGSVLTLLKDSLTLVALLAYLLWLNWQLTLFVGVLFPTVALVMRALGRRLHRLTVEGQQANDELAYVVEENVLAWKIVRLHGAEAHQAGRFFTRADLVRRLTLR